MPVAHWTLHLIPFLVLLVFLNNLEISGHMVQYDRHGQPVHVPLRRNPQRRNRNFKPTSPPTTTTTEEPVEYEAGEGPSTTSSYYFDFPTKRWGYGYNVYNTYDYQYTDPNGNGGGYDYGYGTTVETEEQVATTQTPRTAITTPNYFATTERNEAQRMRQSDQRGKSFQSSAENGSSQRNIQGKTPPTKPRANGTSGKRGIQRGNSKGNQQNRVNLPGRNAERGRGLPRQPTTPEPPDYEIMPITSARVCSCRPYCPHGTFYTGPCRRVISWMSRQPKMTCCSSPASLMRYLLPLALLQNLLAEL